jgi:hypothetical protein
MKEQYMSSDALHEFLETVEAEVQSRPTPTEFEMAYQARVAIDRIRFAIKHTEQFGPRTDQMREAGLQLLDALDRLQAVDRRFQTRSRSQHGAKKENRLDLDTNRIGHDASRNGAARPEGGQGHR